LREKNTIALVQGTAPPVPQEIDNYFDLRYQGVEKGFPELKVKIPHKKPEGEELSGSQKEYNKKLRSKRVVSEHTMGKMKKYEVMGPKFRNGYEII